MRYDRYLTNDERHPCYGEKLSEYGPGPVCEACGETEAEPDLTVCEACLEWHGHLLPEFVRDIEE